VRSTWNTGRIEAFSYGVFAIAITLLILDIRVPESEFDDLWRGIAHQWPSYLGYATSFITIGGLWMAHHAIFRRLQFANLQVMRLNLLLLMAVSFLPFPTKLVAEAIRIEDAERAAVIFYGASLLVISMLLGALWGSIARDRELLKPEVSQAEIDSILRATTPNIAFYVGVIALAIVAPQVAAFGYLVIAIVAVLRARGDETQRPTAAESGLRNASRALADSAVGSVCISPKALRDLSCWESATSFLQRSRGVEPRAIRVDTP
jgi:TMEM175 potassium channel family protein